MRMFADQGFSAVTIEEIAAAAEVSPSTVYRYFRTKEGLLVRDEYDDEVLGRLLEAVTAGATPYRALLDLWEQLPDDVWATLTEITRDRARLVYGEPGLMRAVNDLVDTWVREFTAALVAAGRPALEARVTSAAICWGVMSGVEQWWLDGAKAGLKPYFVRAVRAVGEISAG